MNILVTSITLSLCFVNCQNTITILQIYTDIISGYSATRSTN